MMGADYSIADISLLGWVRNLIGFYEARAIVGFDRFLHVQAWLDRGLVRRAVERLSAILRSGYSRVRDAQDLGTLPEPSRADACSAPVFNRNRKATELYLGL